MKSKRSSSSVHDHSLRRLGGWQRAGAIGLTVACATAAAVAGDDRNGDGKEGDVAKPRVTGATAPARCVDLAICLDTSGSMEGLLDAARQKLWAIVNDLALAEPTPRLRVALLTYGNDGHSAESGWVRVDSPFTEDLDAVSQQLFALTTNGGTELVGRVLKAATEQLDWQLDPTPANDPLKSVAPNTVTPSGGALHGGESNHDALRLVVVAGNESADQDQAVHFQDACRALIERGIVVNAIYCGNPADELAPAWQEVARRADGHFAAIDQQNGTVVIATPFDGELAALSAAINETYLAYGANAEVWAKNQVVQDQNAERCNSSTVAARACTKGGKLYCCEWDLVEQVKGGNVKLAEIKKEELPEKLRELALTEQQKCIDDAWTKRQGIQQKIQDVASKRDAHLAEEMKKRGVQDDGAFDRAIRDALRKQAESKGFVFPKEPAVIPTATPAVPAAPAAPEHGSPKPRSRRRSMVPEAARP